MTASRTWSRWTASDEARAIELYRSGARLKVIARILDHTPVAVRTRLQLLRKQGRAPNRRKNA